MDEKKTLSCVDCGVFNCTRGEEGKYPSFCLTKNVSKETQDSAMEALTHDELDNLLAVASAEVEYESGGRWTRIEETIQFAHKIGAKKIGIATCMALMKESQTLAKILRINGFEVYGVVCKIGANRKSSIGIPEKCESTGKNMCNPVLQAKALNDAKTDLNIMMGLCVGHDTLFIKHSDALITTLVTKDRVLAHNPCAALYQTGTFYSRLMKPMEPSDK